MGQVQRHNIYTVGKERQKGTEEISGTIMTENFPQINVRHQTTDPGSSENTKQDKLQKNLYIGISFLNYRKSKIRKSPERSQTKKQLTI